MEPYLKLSQGKLTEKAFSLKFKTNVTPTNQFSSRVVFPRRFRKFFPEIWQVYHDAMKATGIKSSLVATKFCSLCVVHYHRLLALIYLCNMRYIKK